MVMVTRRKQNRRKNITSHLEYLVLRAADQFHIIFIIILPEEKDTHYAVKIFILGLGVLAIWVSWRDRILSLYLPCFHYRLWE